jgi:uncharacterized protein YodC (DUF2158 family)
MKVGDVVRLVSGGPSMTVIEVGRPKGSSPRWDDNFIRCKWFTDSDCVQESSFPPAALKKGSK